MPSPSDTLCIACFIIAVYFTGTAYWDHLIEMKVEYVTVPWMCILCEAVYAYCGCFGLQNGIVEESWGVSVGPQPSHAADSSAESRSSSGDASDRASARGAPFAQDSRTWRMQQEGSGPSDRAAQRGLGRPHVDRRLPDGSRNCAAVQRHRGKPGRVQEARAPDEGQEVQKLRQLQLSDKRTAKGAADVD